MHPPSSILHPPGSGCIEYNGGLPKLSNGFLRRWTAYVARHDAVFSGELSAGVHSRIEPARRTQRDQPVRDDWIRTGGLSGPHAVPAQPQPADAFASAL